MAKTMKATKKKSKPDTQPRRSHVKMIKGNPHAFFKHVGRYNEVITSAKGQFPGTSVGD